MTHREECRGLICNHLTFINQHSCMLINIFSSHFRAWHSSYRNNNVLIIVQDNSWTGRGQRQHSHRLWGTVMHYNYYKDSGSCAIVFKRSWGNVISTNSNLISDMFGQMPDYINTFLFGSKTMIELIMVTFLVHEQKKTFNIE